MKLERILRIFLVVLGLLFIALIYPLYTDLWHAKWLHRDFTDVVNFAVIGLILLVLLPARRYQDSVV